MLVKTSVLSCKPIFFCQERYKHTLMWVWMWVFFPNVFTYIYSALHLLQTCLYQVSHTHTQTHKHTNTHTHTLREEEIGECEVRALLSEVMSGTRVCTHQRYQRQSLTISDRMVGWHSIMSDHVLFPFSIVCFVH